MRIRNTYWLAILSIVIALSITTFPTSAKASEPPSTAELYAMILEIREENRSLRAELEKLKGTAPGANANSQAEPAVTVSRPVNASYTYAPAAPVLQDPENNNEPSVTLTYEALFMGSESSGDVNMSNFDLSLANRFEFEAKGQNQLGLRARTFGFGSTQTESSFYICCYNTPETIAFDQKYEIDVESYDVEMTADLLKNGRFELDGSIGIRYASLESSTYYEDKNGTDRLKYTNNGFGPTISLDASYDLGYFAIVSSVRQSVELMSSEFSYDVKNYVGLEDNSTPEFDVDAIGMQTEIGLGLEFRNRLSNGVQVLAGLGAEWQYWNVSGATFDDNVFSCGGCIYYSPGSNSLDLASELNLFGLTANIALQF